MDPNGNPVIDMFGNVYDSPLMSLIPLSEKHLLTPEQAMIRERDREGQQPPAPESEAK